MEQITTTGRRTVNAFAAFASYGEAFWQAYQIVQQQRPGQVNEHTGVFEEQLLPAKLYLLGHTLELVLKASLLCQNVSLKDVKALGHDLEALLDKATQRGLVGVSPQARQAIGVMNKDYKRHEYRYFQSGSLTVVDTVALEGLADELLRFLAGLSRWMSLRKQAAERRGAGRGHDNVG